MYGFSFNIGATAFKNDLKNIACNKNIYCAAAVGGAVRNTKYEAALCAIGEAYERNGLIEYNNISNKNIYSFWPCPKNCVNGYYILTKRNPFVK